MKSSSASILHPQYLKDSRKLNLLRFSAPEKERENMNKPRRDDRNAKDQVQTKSGTIPLERPRGIEAK
jgi:hypothetical protein